MQTLQVGLAKEQSDNFYGNIFIKVATVRAFILMILFLLAGCGVSSGEPTLLTPLPASPTTVTPAIHTATTAPSPSATITLTAAPTRTPIPATPTATSTATNVPTPPPGPLSGKALADALRSGGYVIYFRHAATDPIPDDLTPVVLEDCSTQRNLSATGQEQAREIGQAFQHLDIPVGRVLASPFCRALDTVRLAFGKAEIEPALENLETSRDEAEREKRTAGLRRLLSTPPEPGTNTILAAHGFNINAAAQITIVEGEAAVFRPDSTGGFTLVATVPPSDWAMLEQ